MSKFKEVFELIGERYLDVTFSNEEIELIEQRLKVLNINWSFRWLIEIFAAGGLWWNIFWWEWLSLNLFDMVHGWVLNLLFSSVIFTFAWVVINVRAGLVCALLFLMFTLYMGFQLRAGSKEK